MGYPNKSTTTTQNRADGFANATITDKNGKQHKFRKGLVLEDSNILERSILNKARAAAEKGETYTFTVECSVWLSVDADSTADIAL